MAWIVSGGLTRNKKHGIRASTKQQTQATAKQYDKRKQKVYAAVEGAKTTRGELPHKK